MRRTQGFTIVELLVASTIALLLLLLVGNTLSSVLRLQAREDQNIPVQQALRGSIEAMAQELRDSVGPRVVYPNMNGTGSTIPAGLPLSSGTSITILVPQPNTTFVVTPPPLYPNTTSLLPRTSSLITDGSLADTAAASQQCSAVFTGSDYGVFYSTLNTDLQSNAGRAPDAYRVFQTAAASPCVGAATVTLNHPATLLPAAAWNPNTYVVRVTPVTYFVNSNTLYRQLAGQAAQVVAFGISNLTLSYLPDNTVTGLTNCSAPGVFTSVPGCTPRSVNLTLTSVPQSSAVKGARSLTASQIIFLR